MTCPAERVPNGRLHAGRRWEDVVFVDVDWVRYVALFDPDDELRQAARDALKIYFDSTEGDADA